MRSAAWRRCGMTTAAGSARRRWRRRSSCRTGSWMRDAARMFRLLPVDPGPDVSTAAAAELAGWPVEPGAGGARAAGPGAPGRGRGGRAAGGGCTTCCACTPVRYPMPAPASGRKPSTGCWPGTSTARTGGRCSPAGAGRAAGAREFTGRDDALAWLDAERPSLIAAVTMAAATGRDQEAMRLPLNLSEYLEWRRRFDDWLTVTGDQPRSARRFGRSGQAKPQR